MLTNIGARRAQHLAQHLAPHTAHLATVLAAAVVLAAADARAQSMTRCASCHFANLARVPAASDLSEWQRSPHARAGVGCASCHGGDPWTYEPALAHRGVLSPINGASPVNVRNLTATCSTCHQAIAQTFARTRHHALTALGDTRAPACTTCHGAMAARVPSPAAAEARCAECHASDSLRGSYPAAMRVSIESLEAVRRRAADLTDAIDRVDDVTKRAQLTVGLHEATRAVDDAIAAMHAWNIRTLDERLDAARRKVDSVEANLAPTSGSDR
jgi:hypothetical protein